MSSIHRFLQDPCKDFEHDLFDATYGSMARDVCMKCLPVHCLRSNVSNLLSWIFFPLSNRPPDFPLRSHVNCDKWSPLKRCLWNFVLDIKEMTFLEEVIIANDKFSFLENSRKYVCGSAYYRRESDTSGWKVSTYVLAARKMQLKPSYKHNARFSEDCCWWYPSESLAAHLRKYFPRRSL